VVELLRDRERVIDVLTEHFDSFASRDRPWLYFLAGLLLEDREAYDQFLMLRLPKESDRLCVHLIEKRFEGRSRQ
jgi:hypothetical protein